jgi:hypothetical protein
MRLSSSFSVPVGPDRVFAHFVDADTMRACVPGCVELERTDEHRFRGRLVNEVAHVRFSAGFTAEITELAGDERIRAVLRGEDRQLGSSIRIDTALSLRAAGDGRGALVDFDMDMALWGKIGRLGESIVRRRSEEVERQFVADFRRACAAGPPGRDNAVVRELLGGAAARQRRPERRRPRWTGLSSRLARLFRRRTRRQAPPTGRTGAARR